MESGNLGVCTVMKETTMAILKSIIGAVRVTLRFHPDVST